MIHKIKRRLVTCDHYPCNTQKVYDSIRGYETAIHKVLDCRKTKCLLCHNGKTLTKRRFNKVTDADY